MKLPEIDHVKGWFDGEGKTQPRTTPVSSWKEGRVIKLFICHYSFITLAQNTIVIPQIVRFLGTVQTGYSPFLEKNWSVIFSLYKFHWIAIHFLIHYVPFKNCAVCYCFLIIRPPEYRFINEVCFQSFCLLSILAEKLVYLKYERVLLSSNDRLIGFFEPEFVFFSFEKA